MQQDDPERNHRDTRYQILHVDLNDLPSTLFVAAVPLVCSLNVSVFMTKTKQSLKDSVRERNSRISRVRYVIDGVEVEPQLVFLHLLIPP